MTMVRCPACREEVRVPDSAPPEALVRCPLCTDEYPLSTALATLPPQLIVIESTTGAPYAIGSAVDSAMETDDIPAFTVERASGETVRPTYATGRPQRRSRNSGFEFLKVAVGGLIAIPLAQLILWWLPGDWQRDMFDLGPAVGQYVPWIVPANLRGAPRESASTPARPDEGVAGGPLVRPDRGRGSVFQQDLARAAEQRVPQPGDPGAAGGLGPATGNGPEPGKARAAPLVEPAAGASATRDARRGPDATDPGTAPPVYTLAELEVAVTRAIERGGQYTEITQVGGGDPSVAESAFYESMAHLAHTFTYVNPQADGLHAQIDAVAAMLGELRKDPRHLVMIGNRGAEWLETAERPTDGVMIFGTVRKQRIIGQLSEVQVAVASRKPRTVAIVTTYDARRICAVGDRVFWLGTVIREPEGKITGYHSELPLVILDGYRLVWK